VTQGMAAVTAGLVDLGHRVTLPASNPASNPASDQGLLLLLAAGALVAIAAGARRRV
jgi:hypothetical protein